MNKLGILHANQTSMCLDPVRCGTSLYRFLIFAPLLTLIWAFRILVILRLCGVLFLFCRPLNFSPKYFFQKMIFQE